MPGPRDCRHRFRITHHLVQLGPRQLAQAEILSANPKHPAIHADRENALLVADGLCKHVRQIIEQTPSDYWVRA